MDKRCLNCGMPFTTTRNVKYCSSECKRIYQSRTTVITKCKVCGITFERKMKRVNICPECRREKNSGIGNIHKADFSEYEKWHKETGKSYGKYQLMKRREQGEVW